MSKTPIKVDRNKLSSVIQECESQSTFANLGDLWKKVAEEYSKQHGRITASVVYQRVKEWGIRYKTINGRKKASQIDLKILQSYIEEVESKQLPSNRSLLFQEIAKMFLEKQGIPASYSVYASLANKHHLKIQTPIGKRGNFKGFRERAGKRISRKEKFDNNPQIKIALQSLRVVTPQRFLPVMNRVAIGSMRAAVQLKCLDCCDYQTQEIRQCQVTDCSLWPFRPYQNTPIQEEPSEEVS